MGNKRIGSASDVALAVITNWIGYGIIAYIIYKAVIYGLGYVTNSVYAIGACAVILNFALQTIAWKFTNNKVFKQWNYSSSAVSPIFRILGACFFVLVAFSVVGNAAYVVYGLNNIANYGATFQSYIVSDICYTIVTLVLLTFERKALANHATTNGTKDNTQNTVNEKVG